jgi:hypothetical protein
VTVRHSAVRRPCRHASCRWGGRGHPPRIWSTPATGTVENIYSLRV